MQDPILHAGAVPDGVQRMNALPQLWLVFVQHGVRHGLKPVPEHLLLGFIAQYLQGRPVDAEYPRPVQRVTHHAAVHSGEKRLQRAVFLMERLLIGPLLGNINRYAHRAHYAAVQVVQRGLVGGQQPRPPSGLDDLLGYAGLPFVHDLPLRFNAGRVVLLHVPDVGVAPALHLLLGLVHRAAEAVVDLFMNAVFVLIPDQAGDAVDRCLQVLMGLPGVLPLPAGLLPA